MLVKCRRCQQELEVQQLQQSAESSVSCPSCGELVTTAASADSSESLASLETQAFAYAHSKPVAPIPSDYPEKVGRFEILRRLGRGGFGDVYLARDPELDRQVAIKVPRPDRFASDQDMAIFMEEARLAAHLKHPGIVTVFDVGRDAWSGCFIAMEYVEGDTLAELLQVGGLPRDAVADLIADVADAVHHAHQRDVVHRDLKPANILVDHDGRPRISDFGLALPESRHGEREHEIAGTPTYMPPEQVRGDSSFVDGRADIWSLGVILYEALTGRVPFGGHVSSVLDATRYRDPKPPRQIDDTIPLALEQISLRCLAKSPRERFSTAKDLAHALRQWRQQTDSAAQSVVVPAPHPTRRTYWMVACMGLMLILGIAYATIPAGNNWAFRESDVPTGIDGGLVPGDLTDEIVPFSWNDLLRNPPTVMAFDHREPASTWHYDDDKQTLAINSRSLSFMLTGAADVPSYRLQLGIAKNEPTGASGIVFGYQETPEEDGDRAAYCHAIVLTSRRDKERIAVHRLEHWILRFELKPNGDAIPRTSAVSGVDAGSPGFRESTLSLTVERGKLRDIRWDGMPVNHLLDVDLELLQGVLDPRFEDSVIGGVGVYNHFGGVVFGNFKYMPLERGEP